MGDVRECPTNAIPHNSGIVFDRCVIEQLQGIVRREKGGLHGRGIEAGNSLHFMKVTNHFQFVLNLKIPVACFSYFLSL